MVASWACIYRAFTLSSITKPLQLSLRQTGTRNKELFVFFKNIKYYNFKKIKIKHKYINLLQFLIFTQKTVLLHPKDKKKEIYYTHKNERRRSRSRRRRRLI